MHNLSELCNRLYFQPKTIVTYSKMTSRLRSKRSRSVLGETPSPNQTKRAKQQIEDKTCKPVKKTTRRTKSPVVAMCDINIKTLPHHEHVENSCTGAANRETDYLKDSDTRSDDVKDGLYSNDDEEIDAKAYEEQRLKNLKDNAEFLSQLGILKDKKTLRLMTQKKKKQISIKELKTKEPKEVLPRRASMRLRRIDPEGNPLPEVPTPVYQEEEHPRKPSGPLDFVQHRYSGEEAEAEAFLSNLQSMSSSYKQVKLNQHGTDTESYVKKLDKMKITEDRVAKLVSSRIFSVAVHPDEHVILAAAGDKWGRIGMWDVTKPSKESVFCLEPHARPVSCLEFDVHDRTKLFSSSYDGTVRCLDVEKGLFNEIYATPEDYGIRLSAFSFLSPQILICSQSDGEVGFVDTRTDGANAEHTYPVHSRRIKCVHTHPIQKEFFVTASSDGTVCLWDSRNMSSQKPKPLEVLPHSKSVDSAYFSPLTGKYLLTTAIDDKLRIFDSSQLGQDIKLKYSIRHDNHTGRWLSNFKATWHPSREDLFFVGSMTRPRRIEMFNTNGRLVKEFQDGMEYLSSVCSLNVFHPSLDVLVGGNSSGRVHVFM